MADWGTLDRAPAQGQLLTECQILKGNRAVATADQREGSEQDDEHGQHE